MIGSVFLKNYRAVTFLGQGAMGKVYLARHLSESEVVVIKVMNKESVKDPGFRQFFDREIQSLAGLRHPCIVGFHGADYHDPNGPCLAMEFIPGVTLEKLLERHERLGVEQVNRLLIPLCRALDYGHARHVIHRDLKPANLMVIDPDTPRESLKVMDFGLAQLNAKPHIPLDKLKGHDNGTACGTPVYVAPEGLRGDTVDSRSDLYAVGVILYELLMGVPPFNFSDTRTVLMAHVHDRPPRFARVCPGVHLPPEVEAVVMRCLEKYPAERPKTGQEIAAAFGRAIGIPLAKELFAEDAAAPRPNDAAMAPTVPEEIVRDPNALQTRFDAFMPEQIAVMKLRGFVNDAGGQIVESEPGRIRVQFGEKPSDSTLGSWFNKRGSGLFSKKAGPDAIEVLLFMARKASQTSCLELTVIAKPLDGVPLAHPADWQPRCTRLFTAMRAYLMAT